MGAAQENQLFFQLILLYEQNLDLIHETTKDQLRYACSQVLLFDMFSNYSKL